MRQVLKRVGVPGMYALKLAYCWWLYEEACDWPRGSIARERELMAAALIGSVPVLNNVIILLMD
jgi:hypothetical protein